MEIIRGLSGGGIVAGGIFLKVTGKFQKKSAAYVSADV